MRIMGIDDDPVDVIKKIDDFISNKDNTEALTDNINIMMRTLDKTEQVVNNMEEDGYRKEMLGYVTAARIQVMNILDALDSMLEV